MRYDEETGDMIGDDYSYVSTPYGSRCPSFASRRRSPDWHEKLSGAFNYMMFAVACVLIGGAVGKYRPQDRIEGWWRSFSANHISREDSRVEEETVTPQEVRLVVICCVCKAELDATHLQHLSSFDGVCPCCRTQLHVEQHR